MLSLAFLVVLPLQSAYAQAKAKPTVKPVPAKPQPPAAAKEVGETVTCMSVQQDVSGGAAWLSLPHSRLVVNPVQGAGVLASDLLPAATSLDLGYYAGRTPISLPRFWSWRAADSGGRGTGGIRIRPSAAPFDPWQYDGVTPDSREHGTRVTLNRPAYGSIATRVTPDLDQTPLLYIEVPSASGGWTLRAKAEGETREVELVPHTAQTGVFVADVRRLSGWQGKRTFHLVLSVVGEPGDTLTLTDLRFAGVEGAPPATPGTKSARWFPHQLVTQVELPGSVAGGDSASTVPLRVEETTTLLDTDTVGQRLRILEGGAARTLTLTGHLPAAEIRLLGDGRSLRVRNDTFQATITFSRPVREVRLYRAATDWLAGTTAPLGSSTGSFWEVTFEGVKPGEEIIATARFSPTPGDDLGDTDDRNRITTPDGFRAALQTQEAQWDQRLTLVPRPLDFTLSRVAPKGVTPQAIRLAYYKAWVFVLSNLLPPMPENGYPYPQASIGKASLWKEGAPQSRASSQWESMWSIQYLALVAPEPAWAAYEGQMSLVRPDGVLEGEGLPSRHVQTAWVLYGLTGDRDRLRAIYPSLKRLLLWKAADPRWVYKGSTPSDQKDSGFVGAALREIGYARRIAVALGLPDEELFWRKRGDDLVADFRRWFMVPNDNRMYTHFRGNTGAPEGEAVRIDRATHLGLPAGLLLANQEERLKTAVRTTFPADIAFLAPHMPGFPDYHDTLRGMRRLGMPDEADTLAEGAMRDITLSGQFAESYGHSFPPPAVGVQPAANGALMLIDATLTHNGILAGEGLPVVTDVSRVSGVENLRVRGEAYAVRFPGDGTMAISGKGLRLLQRPMSFQPAASATAAAPVWKGRVGKGEAVVMRLAP